MQKFIENKMLTFGNFERSELTENIYTAANGFAKGEYQYPLLVLSGSSYGDLRHLKYSIQNKLKNNCCNLRLDEWHDLYVKEIELERSFFDDFDFVIIDNVEELMHKYISQILFMQFLEKRLFSKKFTLLLSEYRFRKLEKEMLPALNELLKCYRIVESKTSIHY